MSEDQVQEIQEEGQVEEVQEEYVEENDERLHAKPEAVPDKFWNAETGEVRVDDVLKSYAEMERYVGGKEEEYKEKFMTELEEDFNANKPEEYALPALPEGISEDMVLDNPLTEWWTNLATENGYSQEEYEDGINQYIDLMQGSQIDVEAEMNKLGENANDRVDAVNSWASSYFTPNEFETIQSTLGTSADGIEVLEKLMQNSNQQNYNRSQQVAQPDRQLTLEDVRSMMKDKRYYDSRFRDPAYVKKVDEAFNRLYRG